MTAVEQLKDIESRQELAALIEDRAMLAELRATCRRACNDARQVLPSLGMYVEDDEKAIGWLRRVEGNICLIEEELERADAI